MNRYEHHHSRLCLTLRATSDGGFLTIIQNMMAVAADSAYLGVRMSIVIEAPHCSSTTGDTREMLTM